MSNKALRIIFLVEFVHEQGTYFRWHNLAIGLQARGHSVTVYGVDWNRHSADRTEFRDGVEYHIISTFRGFSIFTPTINPLNLIRRLAVKYPASDIVHTFQPFPFSAYIGWYLKRTGRAKTFFYDWDDLWINGLYKKPFRQLVDRITYSLMSHTERRFPARADAVTVCSDYLRELAQAAGSQQASIVHNGFWPGATLPKAQARTKLGLQAGAVYVGFMGRTVGELSWCLNALQALQEQTGDTTVRLALCGMSDDALDKLPLNLTARIDYLGQLSPADCRVFASAIDVGLLPLQDSTFNQSRFPIKFAEYQASGTPVLYSTIGECAKFRDSLPWNMGAGTTRQSFINTFVETLSTNLSKSLAQKVDKECLANYLDWNNLAAQLEFTYRNVLAKKFLG